MDGLKLTAWFAGMVHGVVVQMTTAASSGPPLATGNFTQIVVALRS